MSSYVDEYGETIQLMGISTPIEKFALFILIGSIFMICFVIYKLFSIKNKPFQIGMIGITVWMIITMIFNIICKYVQVHGRIRRIRNFFGFQMTALTVLMQMNLLKVFSVLSTFWTETRVGYMQIALCIVSTIAYFPIYHALFVFDIPRFLQYVSLE
jgi:hypothetical protein